MRVFFQRGNKKKKKWAKSFINKTTINSLVCSFVQKKKTNPYKMENKKRTKKI